MMSLIPLDDVAGEIASPLRAAAAAIAKRLVCSTLRAVATGIAFLADLFEPPKKKKGLMLSGAH